MKLEILSEFSDKVINHGVNKSCEFNNFICKSFDVLFKGFVLLNNVLFNCDAVKKKAVITPEGF